jgi:F-type H+-transporting ATPase subunit b
VSTLVIDVAEKILRKELSNKPEQEKYIKQLTSETIVSKEEAITV